MSNEAYINNNIGSEDISSTELEYYDTDPQATPASQQSDDIMSPVTEARTPETKPGVIVTTTGSELQPVKYLKERFISGRMEQKPRLSTGLKSVDIALRGGLVNTLYVLGAETSTGKSAIMMHIALSLVLSGVIVLYFCLEMSADEMIARAISTISFKRRFTDRNKNRYSASDILYWSYDQANDAFVKLKYNEYKDYAEEYFNTYGEKLYLIENKINGTSIAEIVAAAKSTRQMYPDSQIVIFLDYLQILAADPDDKAQGDRKTKVDVAVTSMINIASLYDIPVFAASSINRATYGKTKSSTGGFKESGDIEYTGGILINWNWHGVTDVSDPKKEDERQQEIKLSNKRGFRKMEFDISKFRNAEKDNIVRLLFFPAYSYFLDEYDFHFEDDINNPFLTWEDTATNDADADNDDETKLKY